MIKFFRKIRQNLLTENKVTKYLVYAIGEIFLVVIGILIALQINNWNEERKLNNVKQSYLQQILVDLERDKNHAEYLINKMDSSMIRYQQYNEIFDEPNLAFSLVLEELFKYPDGMTNIHFGSNTIESMINTGDIKLLDAQLRDNLISYNRQKENSVSIYSKNAYIAVEIYKEVSMSGVVILPILENQAELSEVVNINSRYAEIFIKAESYLMWKNMSESRVVNSLKELIIDMDYATELVNSELEK